LAEFLAIPETKPACELIAGKIWQKPMPQGKHSCLRVGFLDTIGQPLKQQQIAHVFMELRVNFGGWSTVPDLSVFQRANIPRDPDGTVANEFKIAPDWTVEILSPGQSQTKVVKNIVHCLNHGTSMGWLIDPEEKTVLVYRSQQAVEILDEPEQQLPMPEFARDLRLTIGELFGWLAA
jgi:Uma2 family endonuclease